MKASVSLIASQAAEINQKTVWESAGNAFAQFIHTNRTGSIMHRSTGCAEMLAGLLHPHDRGKLLLDGDAGCCIGEGQDQTVTGVQGSSDRLQGSLLPNLWVQD